jgi:hypothetical protein
VVQFVSLCVCAETADAVKIIKVKPAPLLQFSLSFYCSAFHAKCGLQCHRVGPYEGAAVAVVVVMAMAMIMTAVVMAIAAATVVMMTGMAMVTQSDGCPGETPFRLAS